jgi:hypothetical protein
MLFWVACVHLHGDWVYSCIVIVKQFNSTTCAFGYVKISNLILKLRTLPFDQKATLLDGVRLISQHLILRLTSIRKP